MQQRYYDPQIGRFLSVDPVPTDPNTGANFSSYWYANNNPYRFTDPDGRLARRYGVVARAKDGNFVCGYECEDQERYRRAQEAQLEVQQFRMAADRPQSERAPGVAGPFTLATAALIALGDKIEKQLEGIRRKPDGPPGEQYALVANYSQWYPNARGGMVKLNAGDVWKYGQTTNPSGRYPASQLSASGLRYERQFSGTQMQSLVQEKLKLYNYYLQNHELPPGNRIFK